MLRSMQDFFSCMKWDFPCTYIASHNWRGKSQSGPTNKTVDFYFWVTLSITLPTAKLYQAEWNWAMTSSYITSTLLQPCAPKWATYWARKSSHVNNFFRKNGWAWTEPFSLAVKKSSALIIVQSTAEVDLLGVFLPQSKIRPRSQSGHVTVTFGKRM